MGLKIKLLYDIEFLDEIMEEEGERGRHGSWKPLENVTEYIKERAREK